MPKQHAWYLFLFALAVFVFALFLFLADTPGKGLEQRDFRIDSEKELVAVHIKGPVSKKIVLEKAEDGEWLLNSETKANQAAVRDLLSVLRNMDTRRPVAMEQREMVNKNLDHNGVLVEVFARGHWISLSGNIQWFPRKTLVKVFYVGEDHADGEATHMRLINSETPFEVYAPARKQGLSKVFAAEEHLWKDRSVVNFAPGELKKACVTHKERPGESYQIAFEENRPAKLFDSHGHEIDSIRIRHERIQRYRNAFPPLYHERLLPGSASSPPDDIYSERPFLDKRLEQESGEAMRMRFYRRYPPDDGTLVSEERDYDPNRFYLRINGDDYAIATYHAFQHVLRPLSWFVKEDPVN